MSSVVVPKWTSILCPGCSRDGRPMLGSKVCCEFCGVEMLVTEKQVLESAPDAYKRHRVVNIQYGFTKGSK